MLLFLLAERFLGIPHVLCKMDLKTWGRSKVYKDPTDAIWDCLNSLAPFLIEEDRLGSSRQRDLVLLSDKADLGDPELSAAFRRFFDISSPMSNRVEYCGVALVGFGAEFYPANDGQGVLDDMVTAAKSFFRQSSPTMIT
ncbi:DUF1837 domain-containing protein [Rhizobium sp. AN83]|uniref:HamA C-terminal domain-containing protein n=1 Tax=Rhizobium sp. AN83 TaxID=3035217 RepID=UPI003A598997